MHAKSDHSWKKSEMKHFLAQPPRLISFFQGSYFAYGGNWQNAKAKSNKYRSYT